MRKQLWVLVMLLAMSLVLSGCQVGGRSDTTTDPDTEQMIIQGCEIDPPVRRFLDKNRGI